MNKLNEAAEALKQGWCQGAYREQLPNGETFCSTGALAKAFNPNYVVGMDDHEFEKALDEVSDSKELAILAETILENYSAEHESLRNAIPGFPINPFGVVVNFNDNIAKHSDEVVAMFEKAAVKMDEVVE